MAQLPWPAPMQGPVPDTMMGPAESRRSSHPSPYFRSMPPQSSARCARPTPPEAARRCLTERAQVWEPLAAHTASPQLRRSHNRSRPCCARRRSTSLAVASWVPGRCAPRAADCRLGQQPFTASSVGTERISRISLRTNHHGSVGALQPFLSELYKEHEDLEYQRV